MPDRSRTAPRALVHAVVLNWNGAAQTLACLRGLARIEYPRMRILVVDNGSTDGSPGILREAEPGLDLLCTERNLGYAGGCNLGIRRALETGADYVWLLNNDTLPRAGALAALVDRAEGDERIGAVGSFLAPAPGGHDVVWGGGRVGLLSGLPRHVARPIDEARIDYLQGASLLLRCAALRAVGILDEGFFLYWEDADLCFRLRSAGWRLAVASASVVEHRGYGSLAFQSPHWDYHFTASSVRFLRRHAPLPPVPIAVSVSGRLLRRALRGRWSNVRAVAAGLRIAASQRAEAR